MEKKYTGVGYGSTAEEAKYNAQASIRSQIDDDLTIDASGKMAMGVMNGVAGSLPYVWMVICGFLWAFGIFARGFFFAPLPSLVVGLTFVATIYAAHFLLNYGHEPSPHGFDRFIEGVVGSILNIVFLSFASAFLFDRFFNRAGRWVLIKENQLVGSSGFLRPAMTLISCLTPTICLVLYIFAYMGWNGYIARVANWEWTPILISMFFIINQIGAITARDVSYPDLADRTWYGVKKSPPADPASN